MQVSTPNDAEFKATYFGKFVDGACAVYIDGISVGTLSKGKVSMAYAGGPAVIPYRCWRGVASCSKDWSFRR